MSIAGAPGGPARVPAALALAGMLALSACFRANRPAPVDPGTVWPVRIDQGSPSPFESDTVSRSEPQRLWKVKPHRGFAAAPAVSGDVLISVSTNRMVQALSLEDGGIFWEYRKNGPLTVPPVIDRERIFVATSDVEGAVYGLRLRDGRERWDKDEPGVERPMAADEGRLILADVAGQVRAVDMEDGRTIWRTFVGKVASAPALVGDRILVGTAADSLIALDRADGRIVGRSGLPGQASATPAVAGGTVYLPLYSGDVVAIRAADLSEIWRARPGPPVLATPAVSRDGRVYLLDRAATVWVVDSLGESRRLAAFRGVARESLALTGNALLIGLLDGTFAAVDRASGNVLWSLKMGDSVYTPAVVHEGAIYVPLRRGELVKLK